MISFHNSSRRQFLRGVATGPLVAAASPVVEHLAAAAQLRRPKIRDLQAMVLQGTDRTYTLVKITTESGQYGVGEAYGSPGVGVKEQVLSLKPWLVGKDPLEDPLPVDYSDSWKRLCAASKVPICTGENLARREGFKDRRGRLDGSGPAARRAIHKGWVHSGH